MEHEEEIPADAHSGNRSLKNLIPLNKRSPEDKFRIQSMGGKALKGYAHHKTQTSIGVILSHKKLTVEQAHFVQLLRNNEFATAVRDMIILITTKAKSSDDWHKVLNQLIKLPFLQKIYNDLYKEEQRDIIPVVVEVLREHGQEHLITEIWNRLERSGWNKRDPPTFDDSSDEMLVMRPAEESEMPQIGSVQSEVDEDDAHT